MITEAEKILIEQFKELLELAPTDLQPISILRDDDYKFIIIFKDIGAVDFFTKSNYLFIRNGHKWVDNGIEFLKNKLST